MKLHSRILMLLACLACATLAFSQVKITGTVVDATGQPIEFATVRLLGTAVGTNIYERLSKSIYQHAKS